jgi:hypothetical protein
METHQLPFALKHWPPKLCDVGIASAKLGAKSRIWVTAEWTNPDAFLYYTVDRDHAYRTMYGGREPWTRSSMKVGDLGKFVGDRQQAAKRLAKLWRITHRESAGRG